MLRTVTSPVLPLARGAAGEAVRDLQRRLARAGYDLSGDEAGSFGEHTAGGGPPLPGVPGPARRRHLRPPDLERARRGRATSSATGCSTSARRCCGATTWPSSRRRLGALGFDAGRVDGIFGPQTAAALTEFQRNAGLTADGICGPDTVAALHRRPPAHRRRRSRPGWWSASSCAAASRRLAGRRIVVGQLGGLDALADDRRPAPSRSRARSSPCWTHPDASAQAAEANGFEADVYLGLDLLDEPGCRCSYYGRPDFESVGGRRLAERLAEALPGAVDGAAGTTQPMQLPILRETRMVAVWCRARARRRRWSRRPPAHRSRRWCGASSTGLRRPVEG